MNELHNTLIKLHTLMEELKPLLMEELSQLHQPQLNPVSLQMLSDNKSRLLSTINYYEVQRKQQEDGLGITAPYEASQTLKRLWQNVIASAQIASDLNSHISPLLELQMQKAKALQNLVKQVNSSVSIYNAEGKSPQSMTGKACNINV